MAIGHGDFDWKKSGCLDSIVSNITFENLCVETRLLTKEEIRLESQKINTSWSRYAYR